MSLDAAVEAARAAGEIQRKNFAGSFAVRKKGAVDMVTEVDLACEAAIRQILGQRCPGSAVLGEEEGLQGSSEMLWIVDPLDGTTNYSHAVPHFCVSIALEVSGVLQLGVLYDPMRDELFTATAQGPALLNNAPLHVSERALLDDSLLATGFPYTYRTSPRHNFDAFADLTRRSQGVRRFGAAALDLAYVAAGRFEGFWEIGLKPWDTAAGTLLVERAGGRVTGLGGEAYACRMPDVLASNGLVHDEMVAALSPHFRGES